MATTALGIMQASDGAGLDPLTHRRIIKGRWSNTGVVSGLSVTGRSDLSYQVASGVAVASRSGSDGYVELYFEGGTAGPVEAGDPSNPRIDAVWVKAGDIQQGDPDNRVHVGVAQGTPSASPVCPSVPAGCTIIAQMRMPAGSTKTSSATRSAVADSAIPYGASLGLLTSSRLNYEGPSNWTDDGRDYYENSVQFSIPTDRVIEFRYTACVCAASATNPSVATQNNLDTACWYVGIQLDGKDVTGGGGQFQVFRAWEPVTLSVVTTVSAGTHTARTRNHRVQWGCNLFFVAHTDKTQTYQGRTLEVWDRGVAR